ncbi:hypothetical protein P154DRAFT_582623 [Amniculicola lignicola CBS 123094]|uniref:Uncharacterized protein n=1 Tax=Amniculicola lignicola CBS 123094 TaxID=1392246 RepID=A0A6A5VVQ9_9PLEO|nr:hypothetical protein P154DRAFT_582623 [Amniculicola lignicola CBS 123094]
MPKRRKTEEGYERHLESTGGHAAKKLGNLDCTRRPENLVETARSEDQVFQDPLPLSIMHFIPNMAYCLGAPHTWRKCFRWCEKRNSRDARNSIRRLIGEVSLRVKWHPTPNDTANKAKIWRWPMVSKMVMRKEPDGKRALLAGPVMQSPQEHRYVPL